MKRISEKKQSFLMDYKIHHTSKDYKLKKLESFEFKQIQL